MLTNALSYIFNDLIRKYVCKGRVTYSRAISVCLLASACTVSSIYQRQIMKHSLSYLHAHGAFKSY